MKIVGREYEAEMEKSRIKGQQINILETDGNDRYYRNGIREQDRNQDRQRSRNYEYNLEDKIILNTNYVEVKSKYCKVWEYWKCKSGTSEYNEWIETHTDQCQANHEGLFGKMEVDAVIEMFKRSESLHGLKYANYIGDGDSKTLKGILESEPYENLLVKKRMYWPCGKKDGHSVKEFKNYRNVSSTAIL